MYKEVLTFILNSPYLVALALLFYCVPIYTLGKVIIYLIKEYKSAFDRSNKNQEKMAEAIKDSAVEFAKFTEVIRRITPGGN